MCPPVEVGIGDDGAVLLPNNRRQVVVTDMLLEGVHFDFRTASPELVGHKSLAVNLSDIAAMGCRPTAAFVSIALPRSLESAESFLRQLYDGMEALAERYQFCLAGGDTNTWDGPFAVNVCVTGTPVKDRPVLRAGAVPGDGLFVTGPLGGSLHSGRHLNFEPRLEAAAWLVEHAEIHAMMDISDGLSLDLQRLTAASGCGAIIDGAQVPIHQHVTDQPQTGQPLDHALNDGEDFELLFAAPAQAFAAEDTDANRPALWQIGVVVAESGCWLRSETGKLTELTAAGWQHMTDNP